jgi:excisionase family DNA binding protein
MTTHTTPAPRVLLSAEQAAKILGIGRTNMFALIKRGEIDSVKVGRLRRVPEDAIDAYAERLMSDQDPTTTP